LATFVRRLINEHDRTQLEIDEQMVSSFDKLYPNSFRLLVSAELLKGIVDGLDGTTGERNGVWNGHPGE